MAGTAYQGCLLSGIPLGEDDTLNVDTGAAAIKTVYHGWNWYQPYPPPVELEQFPRRMTNLFSMTFKEQKRETNAETTFIHIVYRITK